MRRRVLPISEVMVFSTIFVIAPNTHAFSGAGSGTDVDPYVITNVDELQEMSDHINDSSVHFILGNSIDASDTRYWNGGDGFIPIGSEGPYTDKVFRGYFDGKGHAIDGLYVFRPDTDCVGLFGGATGGTIGNVALTNVDITGRHYVAGLIGFAGNTNDRARCYTTGKVKGEWYVGGLIGRGWDAGISDCYSVADVTGLSGVGGLIGWKDGGFVKHCYSAGLVVGDTYVGGLVGHSSSTVSWLSCYWDVQTSGQSTSAGGGQAEPHRRCNGKQHTVSYLIPGTSTPCGISLKKQVILSCGSLRMIQRPRRHARSSVQEQRRIRTSSRMPKSCRR